MQKKMLSAELTSTTKTTSLLPAQRPQEDIHKGRLVGTNEMLVVQ